MKKSTVKTIAIALLVAAAAMWIRSKKQSAAAAAPDQYIGPGAGPE